MIKNMVTQDDYVRLYNEVVKMRTAQKAFFKARKEGKDAKDFLAQSKTHERNVDVMIMRIQDELRNPSFL